MASRRGAAHPAFVWAQRQCPGRGDGLSGQLVIVVRSRILASRSIQDAGTSFSPDQAMACRLLSLTGVGAEAIGAGDRPAAPGSRRRGEPAELPLQLGPLDGGEVGP